MTVSTSPATTSRARVTGVCKSQRTPNRGAAAGCCGWCAGVTPTWLSAAGSARSPSRRTFFRIELGRISRSTPEQEAPHTVQLQRTVSPPRPCRKGKGVSQTEQQVVSPMPFPSLTTTTPANPALPVLTSHHNTVTHAAGPHGAPRRCRISQLIGYGRAAQQPFPNCRYDQ